MDKSTRRMNLNKISIHYEESKHKIFIWKWQNTKWWRI